MFRFGRFGLSPSTRFISFQVQRRMFCLFVCLDGLMKRAFEWNKKWIRWGLIRRIHFVSVICTFVPCVALWFQQKIELLFIEKTFFPLITIMKCACSFRTIVSYIIIIGTILLVRIKWINNFNHFSNALINIGRIFSFNNFKCRTVNNWKWTVKKF